MTNVIFSFDTEDYVNPHAADGILRVSRIVREAGFTPCHNLVARTAEALEKWGRQDVLDELKKCEIETHSLAHSHHPTINEYTDIADFDEAMRRGTMYRQFERHAHEETCNLFKKEAE